MRGMEGRRNSGERLARLRRVSTIACTLILALFAAANTATRVESQDSAFTEAALSVKVPDALTPPEHRQSVTGLSKGKFLVASRGMADPSFSETVILLIDHGPHGAVGVIINRPTEKRLSEIFPEIKGLKQRKDLVYLGGPVGMTQMLMLIQSPEKPEETGHVIGDIYVGTGRQVLDRTVSDERGLKFRVYAGYSGWAPGQLEREVMRGDWHILRADSDTVFGRKSSEIWPELIRKSSIKWVRTRLLEEVKVVGG